MPIWPFKRRQSSVISEGTTPYPSNEKDKQFARLQTFPRRATHHTTDSTRRLSHLGLPADRSWSEKEQGQRCSGREDMPTVMSEGARDMSQPPASRKMASSPHLRQLHQDRNSISQNFRRPSTKSRHSAQPDAPNNTSHLRSRTIPVRRTYNTIDSPRRGLSTRSKRPDYALSNQEVRDMLSSLPTPKRPGDIPLRRDSKKLRSVSLRASSVSLPQDASLHSGASNKGESRGWEVGNLAVFNPRPSVRLSSMPQRPTPIAPPAALASNIPSIDSTRRREKTPAPRSPVGKKRQIVGDQANELDAHDLRAVLERDAKRKARRQRRAGSPQRVTSDTAPDSAEVRSGRQLKRGGRPQIESGEGHYRPPIPRNPFASPLDVHPAFRTLKVDETAGPSIEGDDMYFTRRAPSEEPAYPSDAIHPVENVGSSVPTAVLDDANAVNPQNPFLDEISERDTQKIRSFHSLDPSSTQERHTEESAVQTAQAMHLLHTQTPPLSPVSAADSDSNRPRNLEFETTRSDGRAGNARSPTAVVGQTASYLPAERRSGNWASLFRRGAGSKFSRDAEGRASSSDFSFSNTSRESMRSQPLPAHLMDVQSPRFAMSTAKSGVPARTQSKFREDLPEFLASPPISRTQSPDIRNSPYPGSGGRSSPFAAAVDTDARIVALDEEARVHEEAGPVDAAPSSRKHGQMSSSLASIDTEGSWLASGGSTKRRSNHSTFSKSLSRRNPDFSASYEELGGDKDAEYMQRNLELRNPESADEPRFGAALDVRGASVLENPREIGPPGEPFRVFDGVQRQATLVQREERAKSREGLLTELAHADAVELAENSEKENADSDEYEPDSPGPQLQSARSVHYNSRHSRQFSAGSAKLLDLPSSKRGSIDVNADLPGPVFPRIESPDPLR